MFAYCRNNPVIRKDIAGTTVVAIFDSNGNHIPDEKEYGGNGGNTGSVQAPSGNDGSAGYSYSTPSGGGGPTSSVQVGNTKVSFEHGGRHIDFYDISGLESAIANDAVLQPPTTGNSLSVPISYGGFDFTYRYFTFSSTHIYVGTYYYTVAI